MPAPRTYEVDTVRGLALFGICVVNVPFLSMPIEAVMAEATAPWDRAANFLVQLLFQGKFFILFSFLFGWGFAIQIASAERAGANVMARYVRRLLGLLLIGIAHAVFVFFGDILVLYSILGLVLIPLRNWAPERLLKVACGFVVLAAAVLVALAFDIGEPIASAKVGPGYLGGFVDATLQRVADWPSGFAFIALFNGPLALAAFCSGLAAAESNFFGANSQAYISVRRRVPALLVIGLALNMGYALAMSGFIENETLALAAFAGLSIGAPSLSAVYLVGAVEMARRGLFQGTAATGRMSLSAYVGEGVLAGLIFNGYGLALYGQAGALACLGLAIAIFIATHWLCGLWLRYRDQGPLEALLRAITRGRS